VPALKDGKGKVMGKGKGKVKGKGNDDIMTILIKSPTNEQRTMSVHGSETLGNVRDRLPMDPELGPDANGDVIVMKALPLTLSLDVLNIQDGDTLFVNLATPGLFWPGQGMFASESRSCCGVS
jgi:hypothetical protein